MRAIVVSLVIVLWVGAVAPLATAQQTDSVEATAYDGKRPQLADHRFIPNPLVRDPFPRTFARMSIGFATTSDLPALIPPGDSMEAPTSDLRFSLLAFEYQQRIQDWMGFWVKLNARTRLGKDTGGLLAEGVTLTRNVELGWMFRLLESERVALSATAQVLSKQVTAVQLLPYLESKLPPGDTTEVPLVTETPLSRVGGSLRFAWAANTWLGLTAEGGVEYGESTERDAPNSTSGFVGLSLGVDFAPLINAPVGLLVAGSQIFAPERTFRNVEDSRQLLVRIAYTGRSDYLIALDANVARSTLSKNTVTSIATKISMRYYF